MFPRGRKMDNANRKLFFNITKFTCLSAPHSSDSSQNALIRRNQLSDLYCPNEPVYIVFTRRGTHTKCVYDIQGFGSIMMMSVDAYGSNKYLSPPGFIHYDPQCSMEQGCLHGYDNGHCAVLGSSVVNCNVRLNSTDHFNITGEKVDLTVVEGPISLLNMVSLGSQSVLEYPLIKLVSIDNTLGLLCKPSNLLALRNDQFITGNLVHKGLGNVFQLGAILSNDKTVIMNEHMDNHSSSSSTSFTTSYFSDGYNNIASNENYHGNMGLSQSTPDSGISQQIPYFVQFYPNLYSGTLMVPETNLFQGQVSPSLLHFQQPDAQLNYNLDQYATHQKGIVEYQQTPYLFQQSQIPCQQSLLFDLPNQNHHASSADVALSPAGALWDHKGMLLQVCPESQVIDRDTGSMPPSKVTEPMDVSSNVPTPVHLSAPPLEILGGSCSGNVASLVALDNANKNLLAINTIGQNLRKPIKKVDYRNQNYPTGRRLQRGTPQNRHLPLRHQRRASRTSSLTEGVEMLGCMDNSQINRENKPTLTIVNSTTTTSEEQQEVRGENSGVSTSTGGSASGDNSSASSVASGCTTPQPVQQYILGCADASRPELLDPENITLKMLLETPYSPRTKSSRNYELEEYQKMLAEDELQRRIDELRAMDKGKSSNN